MINFHNKKKNEILLLKIKLILCDFAYYNDYELKNDPVILLIMEDITKL